MSSPAAEQAAPVVARHDGGRRPRLSREGAWPYLFLAPFVFGITLFYLWPIVQTAYFSLSTFGVFGGTEWVGGDNFARLVADPVFYRSVGNTILYAALVALSVPVAVVLAALLNTRGLRLATVYRVLFFLPYIAMPVAIAMVWRIIFNGDFGLLNWALSLVGIPGAYWLSTPGLAIVAVAVVGFWGAIGFSMIVLGAGLKAIPAEMQEAAALDGAGPVRTFFSVTVPLLSPTIFFVTIITVIGSLQLFDLVFAMLGKANPALPDSMSLVYYFYRAAFIDNDKGYAAALAVAILIIIGAVTAVQFRLQRRWVNYGD